MKKTLIIMSFVFGSIAAGGLPAFATGPSASKTADSRLEALVSVRYRNIPLTEFMDHVSKATGVSFVVSGNIANKHVSVFARKMQVKELMELLVKAKDLEFSQNADGSYLVKKAAARAVFKSLTPKELEDPLLQNRTKNIRMTNALLPVFLDAVSAQAHVNFVVLQEAAETKITVFLKRPTVGDILQLLKSRGLEYSRVANTDTFVVRTF